MTKMSSDIVNWEWIKSQIFIEDDGRISLPHIGIDITDQCNMCCEQCSHLSPFLSGHFSTDAIIKAIKSWSTRLNPTRIGILGGEPLLHPNLEEIIYSAHNSWKTSNIMIISNGLCLHNIDKNFLTRIAKMGRIGFVISQHIESNEWRIKVNEIKALLAKFKIPFLLRKSYANWINVYKVANDGRYIPFDSNPETAWSNCSSKSFYKLYDNKLWYCCRLSSAVHAYKKGILGNDWEKIVSHVPVDYNQPTNEILSYLKSGPQFECSMCPEEEENIPSRQVSA